MSIGRQGSVTNDRELVAITRILRLLESLSESERASVLTYIYRRYPGMDSVPS